MCLTEAKKVLIDTEVLPNVFKKVLKAKELLADGEVKSTAEACSVADISRSAYYKYKDYIAPFNDNIDQIVNIHAVLRDKEGVLSSLIGRLSENGANILTISQSLPKAGRASVWISFRLRSATLSPSDITARLLEIDGVKSIEQIINE